MTSMINVLKEQEQDFEWYPTTDEIIETVRDGIKEHWYDFNYKEISILDCGAGDGRVLESLGKDFGSLYAIEKSLPLLEIMNNEIFILGTDFHQQTLIDKQVKVIFCNPPYSEYEQWAEKIIREAYCDYVYLVIPVRWSESSLIQRAVKAKKGKTKVLGTFDFLKAERAARCRVDVVEVQLCYKERSGIYVDPFSLWFDENFIPKKNEEKCDSDVDQEEFPHTHKIVKGEDFAQRLVNLYTNKLNDYVNTYQTICAIDESILTELQIDTYHMRKNFKDKIDELKSKYWDELFNNLDKITNKLSAHSRAKIKRKLISHTHIDFTLSNIYAIMIWIIKESNSYFDQQLIDFVEGMVRDCNIELYKSNQETIYKEHWRYSRTGPYNGLDRYKLDYRIVVEKGRGFYGDSYGAPFHNLSQYTIDFLMDCMTIANNLGFDIENSVKPNQVKWDRKKQLFYYFDHKTKKEQILFDANVYKNGNVHIRFSQDFICRLNCEFGRLKGWLKTKEEAANELDIDIEKINEYYKPGFKFIPSVVSNLLGLIHDETN